MLARIGQHVVYCHFPALPARHMTTRPLFSVRETLLAPGDAAARFESCFAEGRRYIESTSLDELLRATFAVAANRRAVAALVEGPIHVGFLFPGGELTVEQMGEAAARAGFAAEYATFSSTVVARELGLLANCERVPTLIFSAATKGACRRQGYVEAFIPTAGEELTRRWIEDEVASHVGLTLAHHAAIGIAHRAFLREGYAIAPFMQGQAIPNADAGVSVVYYEKAHATGASRIEVLYPMAGASG
jgi:hypothetical protein